MVNVNKNYDIKLCKKHKNGTFYKRNHKKDENESGKSAQKEMVKFVQEYNNS